MMVQRFHRSVVLLSLATATSAFAQTAPAIEERPRVALAGQEESPVTVTGTRAETREPAPTGSRIARQEPLVPFPTVATTTGVAGLTPGSGMDPFAGGTRTLRSVECRGENRRLSQATLCRLADIHRLIGTGAFDEARAALDRLASGQGATDEERYIAAGLQYRIAAAAGEAGDREDALRAMLATAAMPTADRLPARRTLVALALRRGDSVAAESLIRELLAEAPEDTRALVNLAGLINAAGRTGEAEALVREAIAIARRRGEDVPADWVAFATAR
jgi:hypothetical protein